MTAEGQWPTAHGQHRQASGVGREQTGRPLTPDGRVPPQCIGPKWSTRADTRCYASPPGTPTVSAGTQSCLPDSDLESSTVSDPGRVVPAPPLTRFGVRFRRVGLPIRLYLHHAMRMSCLGSLCLTATLGAGAAGVTHGHHQPDCGGPEYRQFDFFLGDWDAYDVAAPDRLAARNQVTRILDGCVVHEHYWQRDGLVGESFSLYDAARHRWHQTWVTNRGALLLLDGALDGDRMVLTAAEPGAKGGTTLLRGVWQATDSGVHEIAERSSDGGRTWSPLFDIVFRPHTTPGDLDQ